jgi:ketopantoate reductase
LAYVGTSIALIGPGAIGATVAAYLHAAGYPVLLCGHTPRESIEVRPDDHDPIVLPGPEAAATLAEPLRGAGVTVELEPDFGTAAWHKLLLTSCRPSMAGIPPACLAVSLLIEHRRRPGGGGVRADRLCRYLRAPLTLGLRPRRLNID